MDISETIQADALLDEIKTAIKDVFVAKVRKCGDELRITFPNGQTFAVTVWEDKFYENKILPIK